MAIGGRLYCALDERVVHNGMNWVHQTFLNGDPLKQVFKNKNPRSYPRVFTSIATRATKVTYFFLRAFLVAFFLVAFLAAFFLAMFVSSCGDINSRF